FTQTVLQHTTTTTITSVNPSPSTFGDVVSFTATVTPTLDGVRPTGTVSFKEGATTLGTGTLTNVGGVATATFSTADVQLVGGTHTIFAVYNNDINFAGSTSANVTQIVNRHTTTTTITSALPAPSMYGQQVTFVAQVTPT